MNTTVIILSYNSEKNIKNCFREIKNFDLGYIKDIVFVDNKSTDNTVNEIQNCRENLKIKDKVKIIINNKNYNQGGSIKIAIKYFLENNSENIIFVHSSGKCQLDLVVNNFLNIKKNNPKSEVIHASRFHKNSKLNNYSKKNIIGNILFNYLTILFTGYKFSDSGCGIFFANKSAFQNIDYTSLTNGPQFNPQLNILFKKQNVKITNCSLNWSHGVVKSNVKVIKYAFILFHILLRYFLFHRLMKKNNFWHIEDQKSYDYKIF